MSKKKPYYLMTKKEKIAHVTVCLARWIEAKCFDVMIPYIKGSLCVVDCEGNWIQIDVPKLFEELGIEWTGGLFFGDVLQRERYDVRDVCGGYIVVGSHKK